MCSELRFLTVFCPECFLSIRIKLLYKIRKSENRGDTNQVSQFQDEIIKRLVRTASFWQVSHLTSSFKLRVHKLNWSKMAYRLCVCVIQRQEWHWKKQCAFWLYLMWQHQGDPDIVVKRWSECFTWMGVCWWRCGGGTGGRKSGTSAEAHGPEKGEVLSEESTATQDKMILYSRRS